MKYSSLFTHPSQIPINRAFGEVKSSRNSSPLFTHKGTFSLVKKGQTYMLIELKQKQEAW